MEYDIQVTKSIEEETGDLVYQAWCKDYPSLYDYASTEEQAIVLLKESIDMTNEYNQRINQLTKGNNMSKFNRYSRDMELSVFQLDNISYVELDPLNFNTNKHIKKKINKAVKFINPDKILPVKFYRDIYGAFRPIDGFKCNKDLFEWLILWLSGCCTRVEYSKNTFVNLITVDAPNAMRSDSISNFQVDESLKEGDLPNLLLNFTKPQYRKILVEIINENDIQLQGTFEVHECTKDEYMKMREFFIPSKPVYMSKFYSWTLNL